MTEQHDVKLLNELIATTIDSAEGYEQAAKEATNPIIASSFKQWAFNRRQVAQDLQTQVRLLGAKPDDEGTILASAHRVFVNVRHALSSGDAAVVQEVKRGEDHIKRKFEVALEDDGSSDATRLVIEKAYASIVVGHDEARALKNGLAS